jgi:hypothetical protein
LPSRDSQKPTFIRSILLHMKAIPLVRASVVLPFVKFLDHIGAPTERLLVRANLPICAFQNPEALIPFNQSFAFIEQAARSEGLENFGLLVAQQTQFLDLGAFGALVAQSLTLHDFLQKLLRLHQTLLNGEQIWLTEEGDSRYCPSVSVMGELG